MKLRNPGQPGCRPARNRPGLIERTPIIRGALVVGYRDGSSLGEGSDDNQSLNWVSDPKALALSLQRIGRQTVG